MHLKLTTPILTFVLLITCASITRAQVSVDEAQRRLQEKLATRPSTTPPPSTEVERLRAENLRLRERVMALEEEVTVLKGSLARASASATGPATRPAVEAVAANPDPAQKPLVGHWRGGDITTGSGYLLTFNADGTYQQLFTASGQKETGQFRVFDDGMMEMWNDKWPDTKKHNQYKVTSTPVQLTLTPVIVDGLEVKTPRALVLAKAE